jgi:hypothetical protein
MCFYPLNDTCIGWNKNVQFKILFQNNTVEHFDRAKFPKQDYVPFSKMTLERPKIKLITYYVIVCALNLLFL